jgi:hypothetical protein
LKYHIPTHLCFVEQERRLQLKVEFLGDWLDEVFGGSPVENEEAVLGVARPLVHEQGAFGLGLLPFVRGEPRKRKEEEMKSNDSGTIRNKIQFKVRTKTGNGHEYNFVWKRKRLKLSVF